MSVTFNKYLTIGTPRLWLVCCNKQLLEAVLSGDEALSRQLGVTIPDKWTEFGKAPFEYTYHKVSRNEIVAPYWTWLPVLKKTLTLVGSCGYKGLPKEGVLEIGYEVAASFRGFGIATEIARALIAEAFQKDQVNTVQAHTLAEINASGSVLKKCGMTRVDEINDPEDGKIWRWELKKQS